ncbi:diguanylate cyclase (GGDEF) domain-containing protein [Alkalispirochaeta americana]|uniref:diguanylate cyclase n=1 Tax=Alkalispirochaeta americana TaxID=159291 RepID=A0A1N6R1U9_9SPIO|nr:diguanylate cyclase [Alkalispirochaeta americana]SIQ22890.1 diguanylate cyclase (GGDEF) domain-containing protein [Alkalispirochaeta americana]
MREHHTRPEEPGDQKRFGRQEILRITTTPHPLGGTFLLALLGLLLGPLSTTVSHSAAPLQSGPVRNISVLEDPTGLMTLQDILSLGEGAFERHQEDRAPSYSYSRSAFWLRFPLSGAPPGTTWILEVAYPLIQKMDLYLVSHGDSREVLHHRGGSHYPFYERPVSYRNVVFPLGGLQGSSYQVYLRVRSNGALVLPLNLWRAGDFTASLAREYLLLGAYFGILLILVLYNLFLYLFVRRRSYLYYLLYVSCIAGFHLSLTGLAFQYLWPGHPWWANRSVMIFIAGSVATLQVFASELLSLKTAAPRFYRLLRCSAAGAVLMIVPALVLPYTPAMLMTIAGFIMASVIFCVTILSTLRGRDRLTWYFFTAWMLMIIAGILLSARSLAILPHSFLTLFGIQVASILEIVILSLALAHRARLLDQQRKIARHQAATDGLTGLTNRRYFEDYASEIIQSSRASDTPLALVLFDLDHFKKVNDTYGHDAGDTVLQTIAQRLTNHLRSSDALSRYGGEEFVFLLPQATREEALQKAEEVRSILSQQPISLDDQQPITVTASFGVACLKNEPTLRELMKRADAALYQAKHHGRNRVASG